MPTAKQMPKSASIFSWSAAHFASSLSRSILKNITEGCNKHRLRLQNLPGNPYGAGCGPALLLTNCNGMQKLHGASLAPAAHIFEGILLTAQKARSVYALTRSGCCCCRCIRGPMHLRRTQHLARGPFARKSPTGPFQPAGGHIER